MVNLAQEKLRQEREIRDRLFRERQGERVRAEERLGAVREATPRLISGPIKAIAGGLGAVPTAIGKTIEQIPTGVGKLIGAVPITPPDYGKNVPLELAGEGVRETTAGAREVGAATRRGVMGLFGLKEPTPPIVTPTPQLFAGGYPRPGGVGRDFGVSPPVIPTAIPTVAPAIAPVREAGGGEYAPVPPSPPPTEGGYATTRTDVESKINRMVDELMTPRRGISGGYFVPTENVRQAAGLREKQLGVVAGLEQTKLAGEYGVAGHKITAETAAAAAKEAMAERQEFHRESAHLRRMEIETRAAAGEDTRELRKQLFAETTFQKDLTKYGEDIDLGFNAEKGLFEMGRQGRYLDRPEVQQSFAPFQAQKAILERKYGRKLTPSEEATLKKNYYKTKEWTI